MATTALRALLAGLCCLTAITASAQIMPPPAYQLAAHTEKIPSTVLYTIALQESGMRVSAGIRPWPWTLNIAGIGYRYRNRHVACAALIQAIDTHGAHRVDAGLGQLNMAAQGHHFIRRCDALDPYQNLMVAARLLRMHFDASGDWLLAAGRYHRPAGGAPAERYRNAFKKRLAQVIGPVPIIQSAPSEEVS